MNRKILIAEDDPFLTKMYALNLQAENTDIEIVGNGELAIIAMDKKQPDILLLDLLMPKVDGFAVLEHIKKKQYRFPVIVLSNLSQEIDQKRCTQLGAKDYFVKSDMDLDELSKKVQEMMK